MPNLIGWALINFDLTLKESDSSPQRALEPKEEKALEALGVMESHFDPHLGKAKVVDSKEGVEKVSPPPQVF